MEQTGLRLAYDGKALVPGAPTQAQTHSCDARESDLFQKKFGGLRAASIPSKRSPIQALISHRMTTYPDFCHLLPFPGRFDSHAPKRAAPSAIGQSQKCEKNLVGLWVTSPGCSFVERHLEFLRASSQRQRRGIFIETEPKPNV